MYPTINAVDTVRVMHYCNCRARVALRVGYRRRHRPRQARKRHCLYKLGGEVYRCARKLPVSPGLARQRATPARLGLLVLIAYTLQHYSTTDEKRRKRRRRRRRASMLLLLLLLLFTMLTTTISTYHYYCRTFFSE